MAIRRPKPKIPSRQGWFLARESEQEQTYLLGFNNGEPEDPHIVARIELKIPAYYGALVQWVQRLQFSSFLRKGRAEPPPPSLPD